MTMGPTGRSEARTRKAFAWERLGILPTRWRYLCNHSAFRQAPLRTAGRILYWRIRCLLGISAVIEFPRWDARFFLPAWRGGEGTTMYFAVREDYEIELAHLDRFVSPGNIVVDAGAGCGIYTVAAAKLVGNAGRVIAFEPSARLALVLKHNIKLNGLNNVRLYCEALSNREGHARLYHHCRCVAYSISPGDSNKTRFDEVTTTTLDSMLEREGIDRIDFLKMDIEGAEELALRGGKSLFAKSHPVIIFEINPSAARRFGLDADGAWRHLRGLRYRFFALDEAGELSPLKSVLDESQYAFENVIAIHKDDIHRFWKRGGYI